MSGKKLKIRGNVKVKYNRNNLKVVWRGSHVVEESFKGKYTKDDIIEIVTERINDLYAKGFRGHYMVSLKYPGYVNMNTKYQPLPEPPHLQDVRDYHGDLDEPDEFEAFNIYWLKIPTANGGHTDDDDYNDCLYNALKSVLLDKLPFKNGTSLKKYLNKHLPKEKRIHVCDPISYEYIPIIEEKLKKYRINVTGDHTYISPKQASLEINLKLLNGHYTLRRDNCIVIRGIVDTEKTPLLYCNDSTGKTIAYDGTTEWYISDEDFTHYRKFPRTSKYILIPSPQEKKKRDAPADWVSSTLKERYTDFIKKADGLKKETNGLINLYKTGKNSNTALALFDHFNRNLSCDPIDQTEAEWISDSATGAIIFGEKYTGKCYKYDVVSRYPSLMASSQHYFPVKHGEFKLITDDDFDTLRSCHQYGIFRCIIDKSDNKDTNKMFRFNPKNYYTHHDLSSAHALKLNVTLITDGKVNALLYKKSDLVTGSQIFGNYIKLLFPLKQNGVDGAKDLLNILWGTLCQRDQLSLSVSRDATEDVVLKDDRDIVDIIPYDHKVVINYVKNEKRFVHNLARILPFLTSKARYSIMKLMQLFPEKIKRVHTDSLYSIEKLDIPTGTGLGALRFEGKCKNVEIINANKVIGKFKLPKSDIYK